MFKKHMTPLQPHTKKGSLDVHSNKASTVNTAAAGARGGMQNFGGYAKATPMADKPAPSPAGIGTGSFGGIVG